MQSKSAPVLSLPGIGPTCASHLEKAGYETVEDLRQASTQELMEVDGLGVNRVEWIQRYTL